MPIETKSASRGAERAAVLIVVMDPVLGPEVKNIVAASGATPIEATKYDEVRRIAHRMAVIIADEEGAVLVRGLGRIQARVFLVAAENSALDWELAMQIHAEEGYLLPAQSLDLLGQLGRRRKARQGRTIAVLGAVGGAGTSTLAAALAIACARDGTAVLVDAHDYSGGLDLLLGVEETPGIRWSDFSVRGGHVDASDILAAMPNTKHGVRVLTHGRGGRQQLDPEECDMVIESLHHETTLVIDTSRQEQLHDRIISLADVTLLVVPAEVRAVAAAAGLAQHLRANHAKVQLVVRYRGWSGLDAREIERIVEAPVIAELPTIGRLHKQAELQGLATMPHRLAKVAGSIAQEVA